MKSPFFSIIIPTYNRAHFLKIAIDSVLNQTFADFELIVIDDGSTDETKMIIDDRKWEIGDYQTLCAIRHAPCIKFKYIYQQNKGPAAARNYGLKQAKGKFICFLDSDDRFRQDKLQITYDYIKKQPEYKIFHTEEIWYRQGEVLTQKIYHKKLSGFIFKNAVKLCSISFSTAAISRDIFGEVGLLDENLPACEDYDFWLRATHKYQVFLIPHYLTIKEGGHPNQQSFKYPAMDKFRIYALKKILENNNLSEDNFKIAANELVRKCEIFIKGALKRGNTKEAAYYQELMQKYS